MALDDSAAVQNISPSTSCPKEGMSESYMAINTFSQFAIYAICKVIGASYTIKTCPVSFWKVAFGSVVQM